MPAWLEHLWYGNAEEGGGNSWLLPPLTAVSWAFRGAVGLRNALYDRGMLRARQVAGARIVSVGNLNVGGTGKTPAVIYLANLCARHGRRVAVLSRGYGRKTRQAGILSALKPIGDAQMPTDTAASSASTSEEATSWRGDSRTFGDEPLLIAARCPTASVWVGANRLTLARRAQKEAGAEVLVLDDGFQHRALRRDLDIVVIDEAIGFGNGQLLPLGPLREPPSALKRAQVLWLHGESSEGRWRQLGIPWVRARYSARELIAPGGGVHALTELKNRTAYALAGIARPSRFMRTLEELGVELVGYDLFEDHHRFTADELEQVRSRASSAKADFLVTTEKDRIRLPPTFPAWAIRLDVEVIEGRDVLLRALGLA